MALPSSGQISLNDVNVELGNSGTAQIDMNSAAVRGLFGIASGEIEMSDGYGKASFDGTNWTDGTTYSFSYSPPTHATFASTSTTDQYMSHDWGNNGAPSYTSVLYGLTSSDGLNYTYHSNGAVMETGTNHAFPGINPTQSGSSCPVLHDGTNWFLIGGGGNNKKIQVFRWETSSSSMQNMYVNGSAGNGYCWAAKYQPGVGYIAAHVYGHIAFSTNGSQWSYFEPPVNVRWGYSFPKDIFWDSGSSKWVVFYDRGCMYGPHQTSGWAPCGASGGGYTNGSGALMDGTVNRGDTNGSGAWVAVGLQGSTYTNSIFASTSGYNSWSAVQTADVSTDGYFRCVKYGNGIFMVVTSLGKVYTSTNGTSWSNVGNINTGHSPTINVDDRPVLNEINGVWVITGQDSGLRVSTNNGVTWSQVGPSIGTSDYYNPMTNKDSENPEIIIPHSGNKLVRSPAP